MFRIRRPSKDDIEQFLIRQQTSDFSYPDVGSTSGSLPSGYVVDRNRVRLGQGRETFRKAAGSLRTWQMFSLGWVEVFPAGALIQVGSTVAVLVNHFGFWSLNACRIVYVFEQERTYAFAYGTLREHAEQGEERFSVEWSEQDDSVTYDILAFSKPRKWQARMARPLSRMLQKKFARDSMTAMKAAVTQPDRAFRGQTDLPL